MEKLHLALLSYLPLIGFIIYGLMTGFGDPLFIRIYATGWIVYVIYQTILGAVYTPPANPLIGIIALLVPSILLAFTAFIRSTDFSIVFIELAAVDMMGVVIGLIYAFGHKALKDGTKDAPVAAIVITIGILITAGYFLGKLFYRFFEIQKFDWLAISLILISIFRSVAFFALRLAKISNRVGGRSTNSETKDISPRQILISLGIWLVLVPLFIWIRSLIIPYQ